MDFSFDSNENSSFIEDLPESLKNQMLVSEPIELNLNLNLF